MEWYIRRGRLAKGKFLHEVGWKWRMRADDPSRDWCQAQQLVQ